MSLQVYCGKLYGFWCFLRLFTSVRFYRGGDFKGAMLSFLKVKTCLVFIEFQKNNVSVFFLRWMNTAQVVEKSVTVTNNSPIQDYVHRDDQTQPNYEMTPGFKPFTIKDYARHWTFISWSVMLRTTRMRMEWKLKGLGQFCQVLMHAWSSSLDLQEYLCIGRPGISSNTRDWH